MQHKKITSGRNEGASIDPVDYLREVAHLDPLAIQVRELTGAELEAAWELFKQYNAQLKRKNFKVIK